MTRLKPQLEGALAAADGPDALMGSILSALADAEPAPDAQLPATGVPLERERQLSPAFIHIPADAGRAAYGTRCATVVVVEQHADGRELHVLERRFSEQARVVGDTAMRWRLLTP